MLLLKAAVLYLSIDLVLSKKRRSMLEDDPCLDAQQVENLEEIHFSARYRNLSRPWMREDLHHPRMFKSPGLQYQWFWVESLPIRGLTPATTIGDIIRWLDGRNCTFLATGPAVWQTLHRGKPLTIGGETNCGLDQLYQWCISKFSAHSCGLYPLEDGDWGAFRLEIGDARTNTSIDELRAEPLHLFEWGTLLSKPRVHWGYSVDPMAIYDNQSGGIYLIDLSGRGYNDICEKKISPAVGEDAWKEWGDAKVSKMLQFYNLRWQGFSPANHDFEKFVKQLIEEKMTKKDIQTFYCETLLGGVVNYAGEEMITTCHVVYPDHSHVKKIAAAKQLLQDDLGHIYQEKIQGAVDELEALYMTPLQFVDARNRLKNRISSPENRPNKPDPRLGERTLVEDISEKRQALHGYLCCLLFLTIACLLWAFCDRKKNEKFLESNCLAACDRCVVFRAPSLQRKTNSSSQVHKRPILSKSEAITDLPPDYPSLPKAVYTNGSFSHPEQAAILPTEPISEGAGAQIFRELEEGDEEGEEDDEESNEYYESPTEFTRNERHSTSQSVLLDPSLWILIFILS